MSRVLVVESHSGLRSILSKLLKGMGIEPIEASSIDEIYRHDIDLVIADASSGKDLTDTDVPVIIITPFAGSNSKNIHYISQPFEISELCGAVERLTRQCVG